MNLTSSQEFSIR